VMDRAAQSVEHLEVALDLLSFSGNGGLLETTPSAVSPLGRFSETRGK